MTEYQLNEIRLGLMHCVDVNKYLYHEYNGEQMKQIRLGLEQKVDVSKYSMTGFSSTQMEQIRLALKDGLDVEEYGDPFVEALQIKDWREGKVPEAPRQPDENQSKEILAGLEKGLDVSLYAGYRLQCRTDETDKAWS